MIINISKLVVGIPLKPDVFFYIYILANIVFWIFMSFILGLLEDVWRLLEGSVRTSRVLTDP